MPVLQHRHRRARVLQEVAQRVGIEVCDADGAQDPLLMQSLERAPRVEPATLTAAVSVGVGEAAGARA